MKVTRPKSRRTSRRVRHQFRWHAALDLDVKRTSNRNPLLGAGRRVAVGRADRQRSAAGLDRASRPPGRADAFAADEAHAAAAAVSRFIEDILRSLDWVSLAALPAGAEPLQQRRLEMLKLLRLEPAITTVTLVGADGRERAARLAHRARSPRERYRPVERAGIRRRARRRALISAMSASSPQTEPYLTVAAPSAARDGSVVHGRREPEVRSHGRRPVSGSAIPGTPMSWTRAGGWCRTPT